MDLGVVINHPVDDQKSRDIIPAFFITLFVVSSMLLQELNHAIR